MQYRHTTLTDVLDRQTATNRWEPPDGAILVSRLVKQYREYRLAIDQLPIPPGIVALLGQSGSGKSTLLRILADLDPDYQGEIVFPLSGCCTHLQRQRAHFSYAFQSANLLSNLSVRANLKMGCRLAGLEVSNDDVASALIPFFPEFRARGLSRLLKRFPSELSVGQRQRVAVARAYLKAQQGCRVLFADEPTANLDPHSAQQCFRQLCDWQRADASRILLLATHDLSLARASDHVILLGQQAFEREEAQHTCVNTFGVEVSGSTREYWDKVQHLLEGSGVVVPAAPADARRTGHVPPESQRSPVTSHGVQRSRRPVRRFFLEYFLCDISRGRDLVGTLLRLSVVLMLFLVMAVCSVLLHGVPHLAQAILESDPLLRLVHVESTGNFAVSAEKLNLLAGLRENRASLELELGPFSADTQSVLRGALPRRQMPLRLFCQNGELHRNWTDEVQLVYPDHPELESPEQIFAFWGTPRLARDSGVIVTPDLLRSLGYDPAQVRTSISRQADQTDDTAPVCLYALEQGWRVCLPISAVCELPDENVKVLLPALLARQIEALDETVLERRYRTALIQGFADQQSAEQGMGNVTGAFATELGPARAAAESHAILNTEVVHVHYQPDKYAVQVTTTQDHGFSLEQMQRACESIRDVLPTGYSVSGLDRRVPGTPVETELSASSHQATLFVADFNDVPRVIDFIESHRQDMKLKVLNASNREFIRTAQLAVKALQVGVVVVAAMFGLACFFGILTSFSSMLRRKVSELAVLKAFGSGQSFVLSRFLLEALLVCSFSGLLAVGLTEWWAIPSINNVVQGFSQSRSTFSPPLLSFGRSNWIDVAVILLAACTALGCVVLPYARENTSKLLSLSE